MPGRRLPRYTRVVAGACALTATLLLSTGTASATPGGIHTTWSWDSQIGYTQSASFSTGTGHIRATLGCEADGGGETWVEYGAWVAQYSISTAGGCAAVYNHGSYETKNS